MKKLMPLMLISTFAFISITQKVYSQQEFNIDGKYKNKTGCILIISNYIPGASFNYDLTCKTGTCFVPYGDKGIATQIGVNAAEAFISELSSSINFDLEKNKIVFNAPAEYLIPMKCEMNFDINFVKIIDKKAAVTKRPVENFGGPAGDVVIGIKDKIYFYSQSKQNSKTAAYFIKGQEAEYFEISDDNIDDEFLYVNFTYKGKVKTGYVLKYDVKFK